MAGSPLIPTPSTTVDVVNLCTSIESQLGDVTDVGVLKETSARLSAIDQYLNLTAVEGRSALQATIRRIEVRCGTLLGAAVKGANQYSEGSTANEGSLSKDERHDFRTLAGNNSAGIESDAAAVRARPAARAAWSTMVAETENITQCWGPAPSLRAQGFVADLREAGPDDYQYRDPDALQPYDKLLHPVLATVANLPAGPCCATADEILLRVFGAA